MNTGKAFFLVLAMVGLLLISGSAWGAAGDLLWQTQFDYLSLNPEFPQYTSIFIYSMAVSSNSLIICGNAQDSSGNQMAFIKALNVLTGKVNWEDTLPVSEEFKQSAFTSLGVEANVVVVRGGRRSGSPPYTAYIDILRAYNADTGQVLWEANGEWERPPTDYQMGPVNILVANNRVYNIFDEIDNLGNRTGTCTVRAYQVRNIVLTTGLLLEE